MESKLTKMIGDSTRHFPALQGRAFKDMRVELMALLPLGLPTAVIASF